MHSQSDELAIALAGRCIIYQLLKGVFGQEPNLQLLQTITDEFTLEVLDLFLDEEQLAPFREQFSQLSKALSSDGEAVIDKIKSEYVYLMLGPGKLPAPPWESVYVNKARVIFQESTLKVREAYLEYDLLPAEYPHVADDHLAIELDFMSRLGEMGQESFDKGDMQQLRKILSSQKAFLDNHLLVWIGDFAELIQSSKTNHFYPQMALLTKALLFADRDVLEELLTVIADG